MKIEDHLRNIKESLEVINESIEHGIMNRQRNIGFNISTASTEMLEVFLHKNNLINPGTILKHEMFNSEKKINEKFNFEFENKIKILELIHQIEKKRNILCYGKPQPAEVIRLVIEEFNKLKSLFESMGLKWG